MAKHKIVHNSIPISVSLGSVLESEDLRPGMAADKKRLLLVSSLAVAIATCISLLAKLHIYLIDLITNISFYGRFSIAHSTPANHQLGLWVILIPAIGGVFVGLMALFGSKAIPLLKKRNN